MRHMEVYVKIKRVSNRRSKDQVSKQARCDGLRLCEDVARLKRERRRLKLTDPAGPTSLHAIGELRCYSLPEYPSLTTAYCSPKRPKQPSK